MGSKPNPPKKYSKEPVGRPTKFTPERTAAIIDAIAHRVPYELAAEANGISAETLYEWLRIGKKHRNECIDSEHAKFSEALKRAEMTKVREHTEVIAARPERWQADAWLLERRWYKYFGANAQVNELNERLARLEEDGKIKNTEEE